MSVRSRIEPTLTEVALTGQDKATLRCCFSQPSRKLKGPDLAPKQLGVSSPGSVNLSTIGIGSWRIACGGDCPRHWRTLSGIPGRHPLDASNSPPTVTTKYVFRHCQMSLGATESALAALGRLIVDSLG